MITSDLSKGLYSPAYVNFLSSVPRPILEDFAAEIAATGTADKVAQIYDQYLNFTVAEPELFSLGMGKDTYWKINSATTKDEELDVVVDRIVSGLFSVSVTMGEFMSISRSKTVTNVLLSRIDTHYQMSKGWCRRAYSCKT